MSLLPFGEASRRLGAAARVYHGIQEILVDRIVGTVDRTDEFDRDFKPRRVLSRNRLAQLRRAAADGPLPAIVVFEIGGAYFVEDGHHRVALAREQEAEFIDAEVTSLLTDYVIDPDVDVSRLIHTEEQRWLLQETGLGEARPDVSIQFTLVDGYTQLRDVIEAYGYRLMQACGELLPPAEIAGRWYDSVYLPGLEAVRRAGLPRLYASWHSTDADLFLWVYQLRRDLRAGDHHLDFDAAARHARTINLGYRRKWHHLREGRTPLRRRNDRSVRGPDRELD
jgi:hypothetical protein